MRLSASIITAIAGPLLFATPIGAGSAFLCGSPDSFLRAYQDAVFVAVGRLGTPRPAAPPRSRTDDEVVDVEIDTVLKANSAIGDSKKITIPAKHCGTAGDAKEPVLIFCEGERGALWARRIVRVRDIATLRTYVTGLVDRKDRPAVERLAYCFPFLECPESQVADDAALEFQRAAAKDLRALAQKLRPDVLVGRLNDPGTSPFRLGLYAALLGDCGNAAHGPLLRRLIDDAKQQNGVALDKLMIAYVKLQPKEAWQHLEKSVITNRKAGFLTQYAGVRALRSLWDYQPEAVPRSAVVRATLSMAELPDVADFAIDNLRRWRRWETTNNVLGLGRRQTHDIGVIRRAILRFALQSPAQQAADYVALQRQRDPDGVRDTEEDLHFESEP